jgi:hypothetical protein
MKKEAERIGWQRKGIKAERSKVRKAKGRRVRIYLIAWPLAKRI